MGPDGPLPLARWDGGILDVVKGFLSGWPCSREPDQAMAVANWYEPRNVELVKMAGVNWIWVTFSNGFSLESERPHQQRLAEFMAACHREGIHTTAYMSIANMFPDDMFRREPQSRQWVAVDPRGNPLPYSAANYSGFTGATRYLACLLHPQWRTYLKTRVDRVIEAGGEGVMWDNAMGCRCYCRRCQADYAAWRRRHDAPDEPAAWLEYWRQSFAALVVELHQHALHKKPDFLMYANTNRGLFCLNRAGNAVSSEDGSEPGLDGSGNVRSNIGLLRYLWAVGEGWRPVRVEYGLRLRSGPFEPRFTVAMTPRSHQLAIAEAAAHHVGLEIYSLGSFQRDLYFRRPEALANLQAAGRYNAFLEQHQSLYVRPRSLAPLAVLANDDDRQVGFCQELADRGLIFNVVFAATLKSDSLAPYSTLVAPDVQYLSDAQLDMLAAWVRRGGRLIAAGNTGPSTENFRHRPQAPLASWFDAKDALLSNGTEAALGKGAVRHFARWADWGPAAKTLADRQRATLVQVAAPATVRFNLHGQQGRNVWLLHLLNYGARPVKDLKVTLPRAIGEVTLLSPDAVPAGKLSVQAEGGSSTFVVPRLDLYALVVISHGEEPVEPSTSRGTP